VVQLLPRGDWTQPLAFDHEKRARSGHLAARPFAGVSEPRAFLNPDLKRATDRFMRGFEVAMAFPGVAEPEGDTPIPLFWK